MTYYSKKRLVSDKLWWTFLCCAMAGTVAWGGTFYVWTNSPSDGPGTDWANAFHTIQGAVDAASGGDLVLVTNGLYNTGTRVTPGGSLLNRVVINKAITVQSVNGPADTIIVGAGPVGNGAVRCVFLSSNAVLSGFTLSGGCTRTNGSSTLDQSGGGAYATNSLLTNCVITGNAACYYGGGVIYGQIRNCTITRNEVNFNPSSGGGGGTYRSMVWDSDIVSNRAPAGGGTRAGTIYHSRIVGNTAWWNYGGGAYQGTLTGCVVQANYANYFSGGADGATLYNCEIIDNVASNAGGLGGSQATAVNCLIARNVAHRYGGGMYYGKTRNCLLVGNVASNTGGGANYGHHLNSTIVSNRSDGPGAGISTDTSDSSVTNCIIVENYRFSGALANWNGTAPVDHTCTIPLPSGSTDSFTNAPAFVDAANGNYRLAKGSPCIDAGADGAWMAAAVDLDGNPRLAGAHVDMGCYERSPTLYVAPGGAAVRPYGNWAHAANNIQDAVNDAGDGERVLVSNGIYSAGGALATDSLLTSRVAIAGAVMVQSVNGPEQTIIEGAPDPNTGGLGSNAVRCVYISSNAVLDGFTLRNGHTWATGGDQNRERGGGGVLCYYGGAVSNCVIKSNRADGQGGGVNLYHGGKLAYCEVFSNIAIRGGGISAESALIRNCLIYGNWANDAGGGLYFRNPPSLMESSTVVSNTAVTNAGGVYYWTGCTSLNTIVYFNAANDWSTNAGGAMVFTCAPDAPAGSGNVTNAPRFLAGSYRPFFGSPVINTGENQAWMAGAVDFDGFARIVDGTTDLGAYEHDGDRYDSDQDTMPDRWEADHTLDPTDPSDADEDDDEDDFENKAEYIADTDPQNSNDFFRATAITHGSSTAVHFESSAGRLYTMQASSNLPDGAWANVPGGGPRMGTGGTDLMQDTNDPPQGPFYRLEVELP